MCSWQSDQYRSERDEARKKLKIAEYKLDWHKKLLQGFVDMVNETCDNESLSFDDFIFYWENAIESGEEVFADQFGTLMMTAKMFFGEELYKIRIEEERVAEKIHKTMLKDQAIRMKMKKEYEQLLEIRDNERELSIKKREALLDRIFVSRSTLGDLPDEDIPHVKALLESKHLAVTFWTGKLKILTRENIPPEHSVEYYECRDHKGCPYTGQFGSRFYSTMARMALHDRCN